MPNLAGDSAVIPPTVGRIVLFRFDETNTYPAIITRVHDESLVNLMVFKDFVCEAMTSRYHGANVGQWDWMPFQKDQQKRAELMAEKIAEDKTDQPTGGTYGLGNDDPSKNEK